MRDYCGFFSNLGFPEQKLLFERDDERNNHVWGVR